MKRKFLLFRLFALVAALSCALGAKAYDFKSGVLYYNITSSTNKTVEVTYGMYNPSSGVYNQGSYSGIEDVIIPSSVPYNGTSYQVTAIGDCAFHSSFIKSVTIPSTVTTIGDASFHDCNRMTSITIPNSVTSIGEGAFQYVSFTSLIIPDSVKTIGMYAFHGCVNLESLTIGSSVTSIGDYAFVECPALTSLTCLAKTPPVFLPSYENSIYPFSEDTYNRATLYVPRGCSGDYRSADWWGNFTNIQELPYSFKYNDLYYRINGNNTVITGSNTVEVYGVVDGFSGSLSIPSSVPFGGKTYQVTAIGDEAFSRCYGLTSVTIPNSVTSIGGYAFDHCYDLTSVTLPNSLTAIGDHLFASCYSLTNLTIPGTVATIGNSAFLNAGLTSVTIPNSVTSIGSLAFRGCTDLTDLTIGSGVTEIWQNAFQECPALRTVTCLATTPPSLANEMFDDEVYSNAYLYVPNASKSAYLAAFGWSRFTHVTGIYDFEVDGIYYKVKSTRAVEVTYRSTEYNSYSGNVAIPASVTYGGKTYTVTSIGAAAFLNSVNLTSVIIPSNVTTIGSWAFRGCTALTSVNCRATTPPTLYSTESFSASTYSNAILYVPIQGSDLYAQTDGWKDFAQMYIRDYDFLYNGIAYRIGGNHTVTVTIRDFSYNGDHQEFYSGDVVIPSTVQYDGQTYRVTHIGFLAFVSCPSLTSLTLPETTAYIRSWAVMSNPNLKSLTCLAPVLPTLEEEAFGGSGTYSEFTLFVPEASIQSYRGDEKWGLFTTINPSLDYALNAGSGTVKFRSTDNYPWTNVVDDNRVYAISGNKGITSSNSTLTATVTVGSDGSVSFEFKAWGEGSSYDRCIFSIDGVQKFSYGQRQNDWETYTAQLSAGTHLLEWRYSKDYSVNPEGDYFAVDNVAFTGLLILGDLDGDGLVAISDATALIDLILSGNTSVSAHPAADVDGDGVIGIGDVTAIIDIILGN